MPVDRQVSFASGELAPGLWGRTDLDVYRSGAKELTNFLVTQHGVIMNRAGTQHYFSYDSSVTSVRLIPFIVSESESYVMAITADGVKIFSENSTVPRYSFTLKQDGIEYSGAGGFLSVTEARQPYLRAAQSGKEVAIGGAVASRSIALIELDTSSVFYFSYLRDLVCQFPLSKDHAIDAYLGQFPRLRYINTTEEGELSPATAEADFPKRVWEWIVTYVLRDSGGRVFETLGYQIEADHVVGSGTDADPELDNITLWGDEHKEALHPERPRTIWTPVAKGDSITFRRRMFYLDPGYLYLPSSAFEVIATRIYRGRDGAYGYIGETDGNLFDDYGATPEFSDPPPADNVEWHSTDIDCDYPSVPTYFEGRLVVAATPLRPSTIWGSKVSLLDNFQQVATADDDDSYKIDLAGRAAQENIRALVPSSRGLFVATSAAEYLISGSQGGPIVPTEVPTVRPIGKHGSARVHPLEIGDEVVISQAVGAMPWSVLLSESGETRWRNLGVLGQHLIEGYSISDWCYQENPHSTIWIKRSDGALLSLSYLPEYNVMAWASHELADGGQVVAMCSKPGPLGEDEVWLAVERDDVISVERMAYRLFTDIRDAVFLDRAVSYDGRSTSNSLTTMTVDTPAAYAVGDTLTVTFSTPVFVPVVGDVIKVDDPAGGLPYRFLTTVDNGAWNYTVQLLNRSMALANCMAAADYYKCRSSVSGLTHLEGQTVTVVADAEVWTDIVVTSGSATIGEGNEAGILHAGLPYNSDFESLDIAQNRERQKIVKRVMVEIEHTRGGSVGASFDDLVDIRTREVEHGYLPIPEVRRDVDALVVSRWGKGGGVCVRQADPMPMTILGIMREYEIGG